MLLDDLLDEVAAIELDDLLDETTEDLLDDVATAELDDLLEALLEESTATELDDLLDETTATELGADDDEVGVPHTDAFNCALFFPTPATCASLSFTHCGATGE